MIVVDSFRGRQVAVLGLAKSGRTAAQALAAGGAEVLAWDDDAKVRDALATEVPLYDLTTADWRNIPALVLSPGIPHSFPEPHPAVIQARKSGTEIIGDIELLGRAQPHARYIGITGTNGKSTTTALIGHVLASAGKRAEVGGNLGTPALSFAPLGRDGSYVLEASSFQLELITSLVFDIAVLLNITPDHLDRHGDMMSYIAAKRRIFAGQNAQSTAIIGVDDAICRDLCEELRRDAPARVVPISVLQPVSGGVYVDQGWLVDAMSAAPQRVLELARAERLLGAHNWQNAAAAYAAARACGVDPAAATAAMCSFPGLAHRQELVGTIDDIRYINDSKATNADATEKALLCYPAIYWIAGGLPKAGGITSLVPHFGRLRHAFLIGRATEEFAATLDGSVPFTRCGDLATALAAASEQARRDRLPSAVVLLSPACASYDQFKNFEERGDTFRALVAKLREASPG
ncbi:MAG: UDP-N-acetylmuramoyl-L-alanine--D-glutamate ligase [Alphaproteobacteria bacterium]|nr:UDP-N-acetylmuramoyl-L-alanine--D-glutamate ligase [Alphaproteobacteria bacterium]MBV9151195.1 UDP-N-acetylmuramoyl-L-alanine--D-glutamate ligase [Alphaproteobacteria bacterium]